MQSSSSIESFEFSQDSLKTAATVLRVFGPDDYVDQLPRWSRFYNQLDVSQVSKHPGWVWILQRAFFHRPYVIEANQEGQITGLLTLALVESRLFGRFLVSLPYVNYCGMISIDEVTRQQLIDRAVEVAEHLDVDYLELRNHEDVSHPLLEKGVQKKVHMRLGLPETAGELWDGFKPKVRNQIRKGQKSGVEIVWGTHDLLDDFYAVFSRNMRDLGTPVFGKSLFAAILDYFEDSAELCVARLGSVTVAGSLLFHGSSTSEVPSASSLRQYNWSNCNMLMYWNLLQRSIEREQCEFDFGRSSKDSSTFRFKKQWGAMPCPTEWQFYVRRGGVGDVRPESAKYGRSVQAWQQMPVAFTRWLGPKIVRGIP